MGGTWAKIFQPIQWLPYPTPVTALPRRRGAPASPPEAAQAAACDPAR